MSLLLFYFFCTLVYVYSGFAITLAGKREMVALLSWLPGSRDFCVALPCGAMGLSAFCDCGIS